jgi:hypothetical protein
MQPNSVLVMTDNAHVVAALPEAGLTPLCKDNLYEALKALNEVDPAAIVVDSHRLHEETPSFIKTARSVNGRVPIIVLRHFPGDRDDQFNGTDEDGVVHLDSRAAVELLSKAFRNIVDTYC